VDSIEIDEGCTMGREERMDKSATHGKRKEIVGLIAYRKSILTHKKEEHKRRSIARMIYGKRNLIEG
jgi:hypothetical protein